MLYLRFIKRKVPQVMVYNIGRNPLGTFVFELKKNCAYVKVHKLYCS